METTSTQVKPKRLPVAKNYVCEGCPRFERRRVTPLEYTNGKIDILFLADNPDESSAALNYPLSGDGGRILKSIIAPYKSKDNATYKFIDHAFAYAAQCQPINEEVSSIKLLKQCGAHLANYISSKKPKMIVALGATAAKAVGVTESHRDARGRWYTYGNTGIPVLITFSEKAIIAAPGLYETFVKDIDVAYQKAARLLTKPLTLDELRAMYRTPQTVDEALAVLEEIQSTADDWVISVDTETTTLRPEKDDARIIAFCFAWGKGKSATIIYDHPKAPVEYHDRLSEVHAAIVKLLQSPKPKVFHNAKFDLKFIELKYGIRVNNVYWDTLLGEHLLDEDKKGNYGLKPLTASWLPRYTGYEDHLYDLLQEDDGLSVVESATAKVDDLETILKGDYPEYMEEMRQYKAAALEYERKMQEHELALKKYACDLDDYEYLLSFYAGIKAGIEAERATYKRKARGKPEVPKRWFQKPKEPVPPRPPKEPKDPRSKKEKQVSKDAGFENVPLADLQIYGAVDTDVTRQLASIQMDRIRKEKSKVIPLMRTHAIPASRVLGRMEYEGTKIDFAYMAELDAGLRKLVDATAQEVYDMAKATAPNTRDININSTAMLANVLYAWGWKHPDGTVVPAYSNIVRTKKGMASTSEKVLRAFVAYEDAAKKIPTKESYFIERFLLYRKANKALNTFLGNTRALSRRDGYLHTQFHLNGTGTGRLSSSDMNMQNIPKYLAGWNIKKLFVPDSPDYALVNVDYKGAEVRVFTAYARDANLIKALNDGMDMHCFFASKVFKRSYDDYFERDNPKVHPDPAFRKQLSTERDQIKRVVFGILYGAGQFKIAETIGISTEEAEALINTLYEMFPALKEYADEVEYQVDNDGWVETLFGRRRRFPLHKERKYRGRARRQGRNFKIQSTSSDIVIGQLIEMDEPLRKDFGGRLLLTVHDSLVFQFPKSKLNQLQDFVDFYAEKRVQEKYPWLPVPFSAEISIGDNYGECMSLDKYMKNLTHEATPEGVVEEQELLNDLRNAAFETEAPNEG